MSSFFKKITFSLIILISVVCSIQNVFADDETCIPYKYLKYEFISEHYISNFNGCNYNDKITISNGLKVQCNEDIDITNFNGRVILLGKIFDVLKCDPEGQMLQNYMNDECVNEEKRFEQKVNFRRYKKYQVYKSPVTFSGNIRYIQDSYRIAFPDEKKSYKVILENQLNPSIGECQLIDSDGKKFWIRMF